MTTVTIVCFRCRRYHLGEHQPVGVVKTFTCDSFPDGIPREILRGENLHNKPLNGEPVFDPKDRESAEFHIRMVLGQQEREKRSNA